MLENVFTFNSMLFESKLISNWEIITVGLVSHFYSFSDIYLHLFPSTAACGMPNSAPQRVIYVVPMAMLIFLHILLPSKTYVPICIFSLRNKILDWGEDSVGKRAYNSSIRTWVQISRTHIIKLVMVVGVYNHNAWCSENMACVSLRFVTKAVQPSCEPRFRARSCLKR